MKNLKFKHYYLLLSGLVLFFCTPEVKGQLLPSTIYFAGNDINNLVALVRDVEIVTPCGNGLRQITTDILGKKVSEIEFCNGKRCGITKIYKSGVLVKEINYLNDYVISYKSYNNGVLVTEINADRSRIVAQGTLLPLNWDKIYIKFDRSRIVLIPKKRFIDNLLRFQTPENVASIMKDLDSKAGLNGVPGSNAVFNCDESYSKVPDSSIKLHGTTSTEMASAQSFVNNLGSTCSSITRDKVNDGFNGKKGNDAQQERVEKAKSRLDNMIAACKNRASSPGLFEYGPIIIGAIVLGETIIDGAPIVEAAITILDGAAVTSELTGATLISGVAVEGTATALTTEVASTVISQSAKTITEEAVATTVRALPALTESTELASVASGATISASITRFAITIVAAVTAIGGSGAKASEPPMEICKVQEDPNNNPNGQSMVDDNQGQSLPPTNPSGSTTPDQAADDNCARLTRFRDYCNNNGWKTMECIDAAGILTGCGTTDPRIIMVSPEGEPTGSGCYDVSQAQAAALECKKRSLIASTVNGGSVCSSKGPFDLRSLKKDPGWYDPSPIDGKLYHNSFAKIFKGSNVKVLEGLTVKELQTKLTPSSSQSLVVFVNSDCPASKYFATKILKSSSVADAMSKGTNLIIVDTASDPAIDSNYGILGYPTSFIMNSKGKLSLPMLGALTVQETVTVMQSK